MNTALVYARVAESIRKEIEAELVGIGLLCRVFGRGKSSSSLQTKLTVDPEKYRMGGKLVQDAIGIRVVLYFQEDVQIADAVLRRKFQCDDASSTIDKPVDNVFSVSRYNLIFRLPDEYRRDVTQPSEASPIDQTFEVQIRTILSEGWHEVEHDLRYKRKADWAECDELSRGLNGVLATLETAEWSMRKIFDDLAYKHYKDKRWDALVHSVLRMRLNTPLSAQICTVLQTDEGIARRLIRMNRSRVLETLARLAPRIPLTADNVVYVWNRIETANKELEKLTPLVISEIMNESLN